MVGTGHNYLGDGGNDVFFRSSTGQLFAEEFNSSGAAIASQFSTFNGSAWDIDTGTTVVGSGHNYLGGGGNDIFMRMSTGQLVVEEFNSAGTAIVSQWSTTNGAILTIDTATTVVGMNYSYFSGNGNDIFLRLSTGQLGVEEFNSSAPYRLSSANLERKRSEHRQYDYNYRHRPQLFLEWGL